MADPDDDTECRRLLLPGKNNLAEKPAGLAFDIGPGEASDEDGLPRARIRWHDGVVDITADEAVNREAVSDKNSTEQEEAAEWLRQALAAGARPAKDIIEEAREVQSIAKRTLDRAKKESRATVSCFVSSLVSRLGLPGMVRPCWSQTATSSA